ncbi:MAG: alpha/beta hydrolase family protein [Armatimonadota bacterium]|nr:alpha/beta hydrolase family protein [Armatimonadota bacterium]
MSGDYLIWVCLVLVSVLSTSAGGTELEEEWLDHFAFHPPESEMQGVCALGSGPLPIFSVKPAKPGKQLVRVSLPFAPGTYPAELGLVVTSGDFTAQPDVRVLTYHPGKPRCVRRAVISFPYSFPDSAEVRFALKLAPGRQAALPSPKRAWEHSERIGDVEIVIRPGSVEVRRDGNAMWSAELIAPPRKSETLPLAEVIERGNHYIWFRLLVPDSAYPRIIEVRADSVGTVAVKAHVQRLEPGDSYAPDLGWRIRGLSIKPVPKHDFSTGEPIAVECTGLKVSFPDAPYLRRGYVCVEDSVVNYLRCTSTENVPFQEAAWRTAAFAVGPVSAAELTPLLEPSHQVKVPPAFYDSLYGSGCEPDLSPWPLLEDISRYHRDLIPQCTLPGDDFGNVTGFPPSVFGMNRLNHCPPIFEEYYRSQDTRLRETALEWCSDFYDLSIWWGTTREGQFGGTRYNNVQVHTDQHKGDTSFMWRSNTAVNFCTKGYDSFFYAFEETGDPRMSVALKWQVEYARSSVHADRECRNIGDVLDFLRLYRFTGIRSFVDEALRLFRELRPKIGEDNLFSQGGQPIEKDGPFIDDDQQGYLHPFAKPYIIGYALQGLPELARLHPDEPRLKDVVRAVADFLAETVDPAGGWRYPHPRSTRCLIQQGIEHAAQIARAAEYLESRGESIDNLLDAIETVLQARVLAWEKTGQILSGLGGWEEAAGILKDGKTVYDLYKKPSDRDPSRDYTEGALSTGSSSPEGIVYFWDVLQFYLKYRPAERLFNANPDLQKILDRLERKRSERPKPTSDYLRYGMAERLPTFNEAQIRRLTFPLAYDPLKYPDFAEWRRKAREKLLECYLSPPPRADFEPVTVAREDRGSYEARKIVFNVSADCRIPAYLLVPKGQGRFPAILVLHDHGAHFSIGKEKVVRPFAEGAEIISDADKWVDTYYGGRFIGDELAKRGYAVLACDALFWGDRGRKEGVQYEAQQELAANLLQLGMTWSGVITWDDIRSAEFLASLPEVDPSRIGAIGLSMGAHRTWTLCAASDVVKVGAAVCWMGDTQTLASPGNNQTRGYSAYSMLVPDLRNYLDYPDVASIACPKPMLFFNGTYDDLFPVEGVKAAYAKMRRVWEAQGAGDRLVTKLWPCSHIFSVEMQEEAFAFLDRWLKVKAER